MNGFEKRAEKKKQDILIVAEKLLLANGPAKTTVKEIADFANVSPVTIFKFFDTKEKLIEEALINHFQKYMSDLEKIVNKNEDFWWKLKQALSYKSNLSKELNEEIYKIYAEYIESGNERFINFMIRNKELTRKIFEQGKKEGVINKNISDEALELYMELINQSISAKDNISKVRPLIDDIMNLICYGFAGKPNK